MERASAPSSSRIARAAATISRARGVRSADTLEAVARAQPVADRAVERDVERPGQPGDDVRRADQPAGGGEQQRARAPKPVDEVVERHRARVELPPGEARAGAG